MDQFLNYTSKKVTTPNDVATVVYMTYFYVFNNLMALKEEELTDGHNIPIKLNLLMNGFHEFLVPSIYNFNRFFNVKKFKYKMLRF